MSECWGTCGQCHGRGYVITIKRCPILLRPIPHTEDQEDCLSCGGTGFSGDAMERPDPPDDES